MSRLPSKIYSLPGEVAPLPVRCLINVLEALPDGSSIRGWFSDYVHDEYCLVVTNDKFPTTDQGCELPRERFVQSPDGNYFLN